MKICRKVTTAHTIRPVVTTLMSATLVAATLMATGTAHTSESLHDVRNLLERTGITVQMYSLQEMIADTSQTHALRCGSVRNNETIPSFNAESVIFDTLSTFKNNHPQSIEPIENWYESPLAKKIKAAESEAIDELSLSSFRQSSTYKNPTRKKLINNIVDALQVPEFVAITGTEVEYAGILQSGCISQAETPAKARREQLLADISRDDKNLTATLLRGGIVLDTAYLFRNLSTAELTEYEAFTTSETGQFFYSSLIDATQESLKNAGDRMARTLQQTADISLDF